MPSVVEFKVAKNSASSSLASAITDIDTTLTVTTGDGGNFPATADGDFWVSIDSEILLCTSRAGDVLTVTRQAQGTTGVAHDAGAAVELRITAESISEMQDEIKHGVLEGWVADDAQNPSLGTLPANAFVILVGIWVQEAFDSDGSDEISVGYAADNIAYTTLTDVGTTGVKSPALGATAKTVDDTSRAVEAYYVNGGSAPSVGKAHVVIHYIVATPIVA